jgi:hypothetical protein
LEAAALAQVQKRGRYTPGLRFLYVSPEELQARGKYRVDLDREAVVPLD